MTVKHRSTGEPPEDTTRIEPVPDEPHPDPQHKLGDGLKVLRKVSSREERPEESDEVLIELLPPSREGPGELIKVPAQNFGFAVTVNHVLYVHVSDAEDGTYQYIPFSAKS